MPDALSTLLKLNSPSNFSAGGPVASTYIPRTGRNVARTGALRRVLGMEGPDVGDVSQMDLEGAYETQLDQDYGQALRKGEAASMPAQVKGQYDVAREQARAQGNVEAARARAQEQAEVRRQQQEFQAQQNQLNREAVSGRQETKEEAILRRQREKDANITARAGAARRNSQAQDIRRGKVKAPGAANWLMQWLGGKSQEEADAEAIAALETPAEDIQSIAAGYMEDAAEMSDDELLAFLAQDQPDATEEDLAQLFQTIRGAE